MTNSFEENITSSLSRMASSPACRTWAGGWPRYCRGSWQTTSSSTRCSESLSYVSCLHPSVRKLFVSHHPPLHLKVTNEGKSIQIVSWCLPPLCRFAAVWRLPHGGEFCWLQPHPHHHLPHALHNNWSDLCRRNLHQPNGHRSSVGLTVHDLSLVGKSAFHYWS